MDVLDVVLDRATHRLSKDVPFCKAVVSGGGDCNDTMIDIDDNNHISNVNIDDENHISMMMKILIGLAVGDVAGIKIHHGTKHKLGLGGRVMPSQSITDSSEFSYCSC